MKAAIIGTTGYTGQLLLRLLDNHSDVTEIIPVSSSKPGESLFDSCRGVDSSLIRKLGATNGKFVSVDEAERMSPDVVFAALPHLKSAEVCGGFFDKSVVIDLSADFRIKDEAKFFQSYNQAPPRPDLLQKAVYGLCEIYKEEIKSADLIANPGCYPTCTSLPLIPILKKFHLAGPVVVNALSGISGAGKKASMDLIFSERTENCNAYLPGKLHRHTNEIIQNLEGSLADVDLFFTPHLVPLKRGMFVSTFIQLTQEISSADIQSILTDAYADQPFVRLVGEKVPETYDVRCSNRIDIGWKVFGNSLYLFSAIDNLVKGASGQAVQNMNIRFGLEETAGLSLHGNV
ncbi:MAG: N-acetyl-gamma-glutamyl-phosphate reductase [Spirochaetales bacterium]|nr:N-acetyl-gamma-glutamyl-phosphate reductase [Spirochaetales bacterium]